MISLAISILWLLIGIIVLLGVIYLGLLVIKTFIEVPVTVERAVWLIALLLILIGVLSLLAGGGGSIRPPSFR
jgi:hypothetical protein